MISKPLDVLELFPIRKTKAQKERFRNAVSAYAKSCGYPVQVESGSRGARNVIIGDPDSAKYLVTAHYDTPASIGIPNLLTPCNLFTFILIQIFVVGIFLAVSVGVALLVGWLTGSQKIGLICWYVVYFGLLLLMLFGPANRSNANDNTSGVVTVLEILTTLPANLRQKVCFVLFDLEEWGLVGSASYRKTHKAATDRQMVLNLDCVGDGDHIVFFPVKKTRQEEAFLEKLLNLCGRSGRKRLHLKASGFVKCSSDQKSFPNAVGIMAFHYKKGVGFYCGRIHTWRDTVLEYTNVNILRAALISLMAQPD